MRWEGEDVALVPGDQEPAVRAVAAARLHPRREVVADQGHRSQQEPVAQRGDDSDTRWLQAGPAVGAVGAAREVEHSSLEADHCEPVGADSDHTPSEQGQAPPVARGVAEQPGSLRTPFLQPDQVRRQVEHAVEAAPGVRST